MHLSTTFFGSPDYADQLNGFGLYYGIRTYDRADLADQEATERVNQGPMLDPHADWMTWGRVPIKQVDGAATPTAVGWEEVDVRSMRKFDELGMTLGLAVQSTSSRALGSAVGVVLASVSVLLALP